MVLYPQPEKVKEQQSAIIITKEVLILLTIIFPPLFKLPKAF
jgi:hypothetical protein